MRRRKGAFGLAERVKQEEPYPRFVRVPPPAASASDVDDVAAGFDSAPYRFDVSATDSRLDVSNGHCP